MAGGWCRLSSTMTLSAMLQKVGAAPTPEVSTLPPPAVISAASTTDSGGEYDAPAGGDIGGFPHGDGHRTEEAVARHLRHQREVEVEEARLSRVDAVAQVAVGLIGRTKLDGLCFGEGAIERRAGRGAGQDTNLELLPGIMGSDGAFGNRQRNRFGRAGRGESAETDVLSMVDQRGGFGRGKYGKCHKVSFRDGSSVGWGWKSARSWRAAANGVMRPPCTSSRSSGSRSATARSRRNSSSRPNMVNSFIHCSAWRLRSCAKNPLPSSSSR